MKLFIIVLLIFTSNLCFSQSVAEVIGNEQVIQMQQARLSRALILSKIQTSDCAFDLTTSGLIALKKARISDEILKAMFAKSTKPAKQVISSTEVSVTTRQKEPLLTTPVITKSKVTSLPPGLHYYDQTLKQFVEMNPSVLTNMKSGGLGETMKRAIISSLINAKLRATLSGSGSSTEISTTNPTFVFAFDDANKNGLSNGSSYFSDAQSPNEFFLVRLTVVGGSREVVVGKSNAVGSNMGIDDKVKITFKSVKVSPGRYEVRPDSPLIEGEYCFMFAASSMNKGMTHKVYDFSIR